MRTKKEKEAVSEILKLISRKTIAAVDGKQTIAKAEDVFKAGIGREFVKLDMDKKSSATKRTIVSVYEKVDQYIRFSEMFSLMSTDLDKLCLTQGQIIDFCTKCPDLISRGGVFFLTKVKKEYRIIRVYVHPEGLCASVHDFEYVIFFVDVDVHYDYYVVTP